MRVEASGFDRLEVHHSRVIRTEYNVRSTRAVDCDDAIGLRKDARLL